MYYSDFDDGRSWHSSSGFQRLEDSGGRESHLVPEVIDRLPKCGDVISQRADAMSQHGAFNVVVFEVEIFHGESALQVEFTAKINTLPDAQKGRATRPNLSAAASPTT